MLTSWTITDKAFVGDAVLPKPGSWPLFVTPLATKAEPTGTLPGLSGSSGSGARRSGNHSRRWSVPEASVVLSHVPWNTLVCLVLQKAEWQTVVVIARSLGIRNQ